MSITAAEDFTSADSKNSPIDDENLVNRFSWLYLRRNSMVEKIKLINDSLAGADDIEAETAECGNLVNEIAALDKRHMAAAARLTDRIKARLKELNSSRMAANAYHNDSGVQTGFSMFDESH